MARKFYKKYLNKKVTVDGMTFDSMHEYKRYLDLKEMEDNGLITDLQRQVKFELIPKQVEVIERYHKRTGERLKDKVRTVEQECSYVADFVYYNQDGEMIVEDAKGLRTSEYVIKRKLMLFLRNIRVHEIKVR